MKKYKIILLVSIALLTASCAGAEKRPVDLADEFSHQSDLFFQKAVAEYKEALKSAPADAGISLKLAKLYFNHADYEQCVSCLSDKNDTESRRLLAFCFFRMGDYTSALALFDKLGELDDAEYLYYYGQTCEKQNLFDQAKKLYSKIKSAAFLSLAQNRLQAIDASLKEKEVSFLDAQTAQLIKGAPAQESYPQAGALILLADEAIEILANNTQISTQHYIVKILNDRGKKFGEVSIDYDSTFERVELEFARTIKPDGEVAVVGKKHIRDVSRYLNFPLYSNARAMIISMPEVAVGSTIDYKLKIFRSQLVDKKEFYDGYFLQNDEPLISAKFSLSFPKERTINLKFINQQYNYYSAALEPRITQDREKKIYNWEFKDIPQIIEEPLMPPASEINTAILFSTFESWDNIYKWWWNLARDKIGTNAEMQELAKRLAAGLKTDEEKARAIYNWCTQNIRYVAIEYGQAGFEPHKASDIFANKYGDCKDQAVLLVSLLKAAGLKAYPVLIGTKDSIGAIKDFPAPLFDHAIACVDIAGNLVFLDPTAETTSFSDLPVADQARQVLVIFEDRGEIISTPEFNFKHNRLETETVLNINPDESIAADRRVSTFGVFDQAQRFSLKYTQPIIFEESLKERVHSIVPGGKLLGYRVENQADLNQNIRLIYTFNGPEFLTRAGEARVIPQLGEIDLSLASKDSREYPIDFSYLSQKEERIIFKLPKNLRVKFLPQTIKFNSKWLAYANSYTLQDSQLVFAETFAIKKEEVAPGEYHLLKWALEQLSRKIKQCVVLERLED